MKRMMMIVLVVLLFALSVRADAGDLQIITVGNAEMVVELNQLFDEENFFSDVAFNPNGGELAVIAVDNDLGIFHDGEVRFLNPETWEETRHFDESLTGISMAYSDDGSLFAVGNGIGDDIGQLRIMDTRTSEMIFDEQIDTAEIRNIAFTPSQDYVAVSLSNAQVLDADHSVVVIDLRSGDRVFSMSPYGSAYVVFLDDARLVAPAFVDGMSVLQVWDFLQSELLYQANDVANVGGIDITSNQNKFAYTGVNGVHVISAEGYEMLALLDIPPGIRVMDFDGSQPILAVGLERQFRTDTNITRDGVVILWDIESATELIVLEGHTDFIASLAFSPDGTMLASGGADGTVRLWGVPAGE